ncbi:MAG: serine hydrolase domain-containing protein [Saprospiraceae bacterium]|nr:serine hydrolase domain-containing protein [Saprospiraceae bacterium]
MKQLIFASFLTLYLPIFAQTVVPKDNLDKIISALIEQYKIPNAVVAITNKTGLVYTFSTPTNGINDVFLIGSNTKSFTALSILQLADKGLINIDKPVSYYLNWFSFANENQAQKITVRHLLNQTSGIPTWGGFYDERTNDPTAFQKGFGNYLKTLPSAHTIGTAFQYSNANYTLLGLIIERVSGKSYAQYLNEAILTPLKMSHSFANYKTAVANGLINSYQYAFIKPVPSSNKEYSDFQVAEGRLASTADDMCRYLRGVMYNTEGVGLKDSTYKLMLTPQKDGYAMGWGETHYFSQRVIQHLGLNENFNAALFFMPQQDYGVIVLSNTNSMEFSGVAKEAIVKTLLNKPYAMAAFSFENIQRILVLVFALIALFFCIFNLIKWKNLNFIIPKPKVLSLIRCLFFTVLSLLPILILPKIGNITGAALMRHAPDYAYGAWVIAIFGTLTAVIRMLRVSTPQYKKLIVT